MEITVINRQRSYSIAGQEWGEFAKKVLAAMKLEQAEATIVFIGDRQMRKLNREFRSIDKPTDVLSFSYFAASEDSIITSDEESENSFTTQRDYLGDVVISTQTAARYATELGLTFEQEVKTLILHGLLHLCGYDHETDNGEMERLEKKLRRRLLGSTDKRLPNA